MTFDELKRAATNGSPVICTGDDGKIYHGEYSTEYGRPLIFVIYPASVKLVSYEIGGGVEMYKWISVKDRLPETWGLYLCYCENPYWTNDKSYLASGKSHFMLVEWSTAKNKWDIDDRVEITHWTPLVYPSKEE